MQIISKKVKADRKKGQNMPIKIERKITKKEKQTFICCSNSKRIRLSSLKLYRESYQELPKMNTNFMFIDISSDDDNFAQCTPIETLPINMIEDLNLSGESTRATLGSEESPDCKVSTLNSEVYPRKLGINLCFKKYR